LNVGLFYGESKDRVNSNRSYYDLIVTTFQTGFNYFDHMKFHRKIIDESHQSIVNSYSRSITAAATNNWCVSGTPFSSSLIDLSGSARLVGHTDTVFKLNRHFSGDWSLPELIPTLKSVIIRHTKAQRIGGEIALALPESSTEVVWLTMNGQERKQYNLALRTAKPLKRDASTFSIEMALYNQRLVCANASLQSDLTCPTKLNYLIKDLKALRALEPNMHAVVLTHHQLAHALISKTLATEGFSVCGFSGDEAIPKRHKSIAEFQRSVDITQPTGPPVAKVFVVTMKIGNVGITLTAASRVYLFEPCLDPQMELQAAGRIHRLGQTKPVLVKKLMFRDSIESSINELHEAIRDGTVKISNGKFNQDVLSYFL
jgi:SNF2 family DNA or RNA helicase